MKRSHANGVTIASRKMRCTSLQAMQRTILGNWIQPRAQQRSLWRDTCMQLKKMRPVNAKATHVPGGAEMIEIGLEPDNVAARGVARYGILPHAHLEENRGD